jgi:hypothetical protein
MTTTNYPAADTAPPVGDTQTGLRSVGRSSDRWRFWRDSTGGRLPLVLTALAILVGDADRLRQFVFDRSLWNDEAPVSLSVLTRGYGKLLQPLIGGQTAPPGWLWIERFSTQVFGSSELALRVPQLVASLALPLLMAFLGYRFLGRLGWVPVVLVALSPSLLRYAAELKPYGMDATLTVLMVLLAVHVIDRHLASRPLAVWAAVGAAVAFVSWPGLLAVGCGGGVLGLRSLADVRRDHRPWLLGRVAGANLPWLVILAWQYVTVMRPARHDPTLRAYWSAGYPASWHALGSWLRSTVPALVANPLALQVTWLVCLLVVVGAVALMIEHGWASLPAVLLLPVTVGAAAVHGYPLENRAALSIVPICFLLASASVRAPVAVLRHGDQEARRKRDRPPAVVLALALAIVLTAMAGLGVVSKRSIASGLDKFTRPFTVSETRPALIDVKRQRAPGEAILIDNWTGYSYEYYATRLDLPPAPMVLMRSNSPCNEAAAMRRVAPSGRFWLILTHQPATGPILVTAYLNAFRPVASLVKDIREPADVHALLMQLRTSAGFHPAPGSGCLVLGGPVSGYRPG